MKISYNRLLQFLNSDISVESLSEILTNTGLEVDHAEAFNSIPGGLKGIVVGYIKACSKHPNADKLSICTVDIGSDTKQIVCGAENVAAGQKVLVATVGSTVYPVNGNPFNIQKAKIRGQLSEGMICAEDELSLGHSHDGIMVLPDNYEIGKPAANYFKNYEDTVIEIGLTANRGDAASHLGVARDIKAYLGCNIVLPSITLPQTILNPKKIDVFIDDTEGCKRYSGLYISGVTVKPSPEWLQHFLKVIGLTPINNIVDATNYVLHSLGQPLHAFNADIIKDNKIIVKRAAAGSFFTTLDKVERKLNGNECMICDTEKYLAMGGIFGGLNSGINNKTQNIFIESAYFNPATVRKAAKHHAISTDAAYRYERGTDPNITVYALEYAADLILKIAGGQIASEIIDVYPEIIKHKKIAFSVSENNKILGHQIPAERIKEILERLDILIEKQEEDLMHLSVPPYRPDVERPIDITEEILRIYGLNNIPMDTGIKSAMTFSKFTFALNLKNKIADMLAAIGFNEIATNTLTKTAYAGNNTNYVKLLNPLSSDMEMLRTNPVHQILEAVAYNNNRKLNLLNFFEFAKTYHLMDTAEKHENYQERKHLIVALFGNKMPENWRYKEQESDFYKLKQIAEKILSVCGVNNFAYLFEPTENYQLSAQLTFNKLNIAQLGAIDEALLKKFDIDKLVWYIDFDFDALISITEKLQFKLKPISVFPAVRRDLALVVDKHITYEQLAQLAIKTEPLLLKHVNVFDVYTGDKIAANKKSYALSFMLQDDDKTLTDDIIDKTITKLLNVFEKETGAVLRK